MTSSYFGQQLPLEPFKCLAQPHRCKMVALQECVTPAELQLCDSPENAAQYWRHCEASTSIRMLKVEAAGDFWKGLIKPKIRLTGRWLEQAGFKPGSRVQVTCLAPGVIELRSPDIMVANAAEQQQSIQQIESPA